MYPGYLSAVCTVYGCNVRYPHTYTSTRSRQHPKLVPGTFSFVYRVPGMNPGSETQTATKNQGSKRLHKTPNRGVRVSDHPDRLHTQSDSMPCYRGRYSTRFLSIARSTLLARCSSFQRASAALGPAATSASSLEGRFKVVLAVRNDLAGAFALVCGLSPTLAHEMLWIRKHAETRACVLTRTNVLGTALVFSCLPLLSLNHLPPCHHH